MGQTVNEDYFDWDKYLKETGSVSAPSEYFRQSKIPPSNEFQVGMKLEARDPRNTASVCVASVIGTTGARLRLRLDGSDNKNDFWRLVDSSDIQPVGTCEQEGELLQPPLGYRMNVSSWPMFLLRTLTGSELAPSVFFKKEPLPPPLNNFKVGMKIEAVDRKNPFMICPATIGAVKGDQIHVTFDGWSGTFDYWCKYDSRDIFPVGWCYLTGDVLQPPGKNGKLIPNYVKTKSSTSKGAQSSKKSPRKTTILLPVPQTSKKSGQTKPTEDSSATKKDITIKIVLPKKRGGKSGKKEKCIPVVCSTSSASLSSLMRSSSSNRSSVGPSKIVMSTVCVYINKHGDCGPYLDPQRVQQLPDHYGPGPVNVILQRTVQACIDCAIEAKAVFLFLKPDNRGGETITAFFDGKKHTVQLPPVNSASFVLRFLENFCHSLQCEKFLSSQPFKPKAHIHTTTTDIDPNKPVSEELKENRSLKRFSTQPLPFAPVSSKLPRMAGRPSKVLSPEVHAMSEMKSFTETSENSSVCDSMCPACTSVFKSVSEIVSNTSSTSVVVKKPSTSKTYKHVKFQWKKKSEASSYIAVPDPSVLKQGFCKDPSTWSVDEVIQFMKHRDPHISGPLADLFRQHEIDGKALLLLKSEMMMKYMGLKLGPALKLCYYIEKLKEANYN
ncbi:sex comb on midleg-like protein 2 [Acomys russatus]|uniref:sex comb on midleg-like protein 2 n=1 Tax=Acomys russatus TaxID=60746 RepID=UPI0021E2EC46|nr:sex comb on midleg-like protein 2 [Acomys russatus]